MKRTPSAEVTVVSTRVMRQLPLLTIWSFRDQHSQHCLSLLGGHEQCIPRPRLFRNARPQCSQVIGGKFLAVVLSLTAVFTHFIRCTSRRYQNIARRSSFSGASAQPESTFALLSRSARAIREWA